MVRLDVANEAPGLLDKFTREFSTVLAKPALWTTTWRRVPDWD